MPTNHITPFAPKGVWWATGKPPSPVPSGNNAAHSPSPEVKL